MATIFAHENSIQKKNSKGMPLVPIFGREFQWALRDAIFYSGSYDQIYQRFDHGMQNNKGRNNLNNNGGPQLHSFPGLSPRPPIE